MSTQTSEERKGKDEELRQVQQIVDDSHDAIIGETLDGVVTSWSDGAEKMFGYSAEEVIGKSVLFMLPAELKEEVPALLGRVRAGRQVFDRDSIRLRKDGSRIDVAISISPVKTEKGEVVGASVVERDITARKKAEESMRQALVLVDNSHDAIIGGTMEGIITSWNRGAAKMFGYSAEDLIGKPMTNLFPPELWGQVPQLLEKVKRGDAIAEYETVWLRKDVNKADVEFSMSPVLTPDGTMLGISLVGRDVSQRRKSERQIKELYEIRNRFITIVSHQLRTPLTAVNWNLETLLKGDFGKLEETQRKFLQVTHQSSLEVTRRIHNLLTAMDVEEGRVRYETGEVALDSLCAGVVNEMLKKCEPRNLTCAYAAPLTEIPAIEADGDKIRMSAVALLENAVAYTRDNGKITVSLQLTSAAARFEVTDDGIGIPQVEQHSIFTRFFRASNASAMQPDAFGLGLFVAKRFIEQQGGKIGFESEEGKGSTFWFELPLKRVDGNQ